MSGDYTIRRFSTIEEYRRCVELQEETWGRGFSERVSPAILKVSQILGGVAAGAYDDAGRLVGFVFGMTGVRHGELVHWSDMLAVRPEVRDSGLGTRLKAYQREEVMRIGVRRMHWTFDPLQSRNAHLNFNKLGIVVREYEVNMYGESTDSPLHRGIGTDRFIALWLLDSERVRARLEGRAAPPDPALLDGVPAALEVAQGAAAHPEEVEPGEPHPELDTPQVRVAIPRDIVGIMAADMPRARRWREATRAVLPEYLARGYEVRAFFRLPTHSEYLLTDRRRAPEVE